jgi:hypothetical protein
MQSTTMSCVRIYVYLKIPDNIVRTALQTLKRRMGFTALTNLQRAEFWELDFPGLTPEQAQQTADRLISKTAFFMNPNKHRVRLDSSPHNLSQETAMLIPAGFNASLLVCDSIDGKAESTLESLRALTQGSEQPQTLQRGIWWDVLLEESDPQRMQSEIRRMAITTSRSEGLLANPHYQTYRIFTS